jgi:hypothetical protein
MNFSVSVIFALLLFFGAGWISVHVFHDANLTPVLRIFSIAVPFLFLAQNLLFFNCIGVGVYNVALPLQSY